MNLLPHQTKAIEDVLVKLSERGLCILEGQQRTGKTLVALSVAKEWGGPVLFLTKKKAIPGVMDDLGKIGGIGGLVVMNYESVHKLEPENWGLIILDECHSSGLSSFPKTSGVWKKVNALFKRTGAKALLMSGTVSIESRAQLFHEIQVTGRGPWLQFKTFYHWWNPRGHYKTAISGGYGQFGAVKRVACGEVVPDYSQVQDDRVDRDVKGLFVTVSRADAGFKVTKASEMVVKCSNEAILGLCDEIREKGVVEMGGRSFVYDTPAAKLQGCHMACGGTLLDEKGEGYVLEGMGARYKLDMILKRAKPGLKYVIFSHYIFERETLLKWLGDRATDDVEEFRNGDAQFCVLSTTSYSMGVDFSWLSGCCIMYSMPWSGAVWSQVLDRQLKFDREKAAVVAILLLDGGVDEDVYGVLCSKQNFNLRSYRERIATST